MKYNRSWLESELAQDKRIKYLFFWGHRAANDGAVSASCFSQWWEDHTFDEGGISYRTTEHYMMAGKARLFDDEQSLRKIIDARSPAEAKKLGREVKNFEQSVWQANRCEIVIKGNYLKFSQDAVLKNFLLNTHQRVLVEASPVDNIWGIGLAKDDIKAQNPYAWKGDNLLGFCLMEVRDRLKVTI
ncbi:MAG: NADAR family protein [Bacteroidia bacterium]